MKHTLWHSASNSLTYKPVNLKPLTVESVPAEGPHVLTRTSAAYTRTMQKRTFQIYRYDPDKDAKPYMQTIEIELDGHERMLLDALMKLKAQDPTLSFRRSCREGVCGSDAMNINGKNGLACLTNMLTLRARDRAQAAAGSARHPRPDRGHDAVLQAVQLHQALPGQRQHPAREERLQSPEEREELNGLYECILCASCSTSCPSFWWNPDKFVGPAGLLQAYRFIADSRDEATAERLDNLEDPYRLFRCHTIMNCVDVCPKGLNPTMAIGKIKELMVRRTV
jgi:succinate dehydrogenase / fumarate reductase iron-sulfur subunit